LFSFVALGMVLVWWRY